MKSTATGRILLWRGGSLWIGLAGEPTGFHSHHAVQITLPFLRGRVRFQRPSGSWTSYAAALVAAHQPHAFEARAQRLAQIFVEPESQEGRASQLGDTPRRNIKNGAGMTVELQAIPVGGKLVIRRHENKPKAK